MGTSRSAAFRVIQLVRICLSWVSDTRNCSNSIRTNCYIRLTRRNLRYTVR
ncbi:hypothetical protein PF010_g25626 [Phytophthora fragariae]|uniref:Uncharacterized protein n=1 Tax=Phytophthora fragariae TaxID=53985 RepID=A0A6A3HU70_9STRA|nr:hypothetical protein PF011_g24985 [Phytophthora fragariae]KAE9072093.1 hypothetical protein PF010_g25626 [Phytophthora fragariae]KAE9088793.1 hypothetical protein PF006_g25499 [Phytophthora fragariae]KAE9182854.1 hypothetical protein PF002_g26877 [Phytophthora fragariae]KAE9277849.1 hypothetical protein PF001_g25456 [Phytophthora fragariae]